MLYFQSCFAILPIRFLSCSAIWECNVLRRAALFYDGLGGRNVATLVGGAMDVPNLAARDHAGRSAALANASAALM